MGQVVFLLCQAEIENFDVLVGEQHYILRLNVAMDDSGLVCGDKRGSRLTGNMQRIDKRSRACCELLAQRYPINVFHHDEVVFSVFVNLIDLCNIGMCNCRGCARLVPDTARGLCLLCTRWIE